MVLNAGRTMAETIIAPQRLKTKKTRQSQLGGASPGKLRRLEAKKNRRRTSVRRRFASWEPSLAKPTIVKEGTRFRA